MSTEEQQEDFYLELGDIIKINAPDNSDLDDKTFYIDYLDENRATIIDPDTQYKKCNEDVPFSAPLISSLQL